MAISQVYINNDMTALKNFLDGFNGMTATLSSDTITMKDSSNNTLCTITQTQTANGYTYAFEAFASASLSQTATYNYSVNTLVYAWKCNGGIMLDFRASDNEYHYPFYITKTNNGKTAFVFTTGTYFGDNETLHNNLACIAFGDIGTLSTYTFSPTPKRQAIICPMPTNNAYGTPSYTQNAGFMPFNSAYNMGYGSITMNGVEYLTNGYFAIKDA